VGRAEEKSNMSGGNDEREHFDQLLTEMDGLELIQVTVIVLIQIEPMFWIKH
jgi:ATP-dependent Zn protease